jgi:hypothetical protein
VLARQVGLSTGKLKPPGLFVYSGTHGEASL